MSTETKHTSENKDWYYDRSTGHIRNDGEYFKLFHIEKMQQRIFSLEAQLAAKPLNRELNQLIEDNDRLEWQLEKLSGKTGYCTECERAGRENKELRHSLNKSERTLEEYKRMYDASEAQNKGLQSLIADQLLIAYIIVGATIGICGFIFLHRG